MKRGPTVPPAVRRGPVGSRRGPEDGARGDVVASRMGPYINRAPVRDSRAICRALPGPVVANYSPTGPVGT